MLSMTDKPTSRQAIKNIHHGNSSFYSLSFTDEPTSNNTIFSPQKCGPEFCTVAAPDVQLMKGITLQ